MTRWKTLSLILLSGWFGLLASSQDTTTGCGNGPSDNESAARKGMRGTVVHDADGKSVYVASSAKELKVARLTFVGDPALALPVQAEIAKSLQENDYDDNKDGLDELLERVRDAWQHYGYFNVKAEFGDSQTLNEDSASRTVAITVKIDAGKQYRLDEIHFGSVPADAPRPLPLAPAVPQDQWPLTAEQLRALFAIQQGDIFDTHKIQQGLEEMRKAFGGHGFINYSAVPSTKIDEGSGLITLLVENYLGKQFRLGRVDFTGLNSEILRKLLQDSGLVSGSVFDATRYNDFARQSQLALPGFRAEEDVERRVNPANGTVDLRFHVRSCDAP